MAILHTLVYDNVAATHTVILYVQALMIHSVMTLLRKLTLPVGSPPPPVVQSLAASTQGLYPHFTLNCSSSNSAATEILWTEGNQPLNSSEQPYTMVQLVRSGTTSTYDNLLQISTNVNELSGQYGCSIRNSFGSATAVNATFLGMLICIVTYPDPSITILHSAGCIVSPEPLTQGKHLYQEQSS